MDMETETETVLFNIIAGTKGKSRFMFKLLIVEGQFLLHKARYLSIF